MALTGWNVLVVEDEFLIGCLLADYLTLTGTKVIGPAFSVSEAHELLNGKDAIHAAVLDINLRGEMVFPLAAVLRKRGIPFIFVSGYTSIVLTDEYVGIPCLGKPVNRHELIRAIASHAMTVRGAIPQHATC
jgi:DNA-binding response OmpR family regulator